MIFRLIWKLFRLTGTLLRITDLPFHHFVILTRPALPTVVWITLSVTAAQQAWFCTMWLLSLNPTLNQVLIWWAFTIIILLFFNLNTILREWKLTIKVNNVSELCGAVLYWIIWYLSFFHRISHSETCHLKVFNHFNLRQSNPHFFSHHNLLIKTTGSESINLLMTW